MITQNGTKTRGHTSSVSSAVREWPSPIVNRSHNPRALPRERPGRLVAQSAVRPGYDHQFAGLLGDILDGPFVYGHGHSRLCPHLVRINLPTTLRRDEARVRGHARAAGYVILHGP